MAFAGKDLALYDESARSWARYRKRDRLEANRAAIRSYNQRVEAEGSCGDRMRRF